MGSSAEVLRDRIIELLPRLRRFARSLARNAQDADDLVQITAERALARADQFRPEHAAAGWLFGILRNAWIDEGRRRRRRESLLEPAELAERVGDTAAGSDPELLCLQDALARLPEDQRLAVALVLVEGLSYKEAASIMSVPVGTVTSRLARGREALQSLLSETPGVPP
ncbi:MAG TPA: RNA polymerase sigma factor [Steroidobacteraceae bacterium]|jgi:RNA polymerase sigma-70 factor (ECF subfamily)|nr:RNA polymerase sigma factor [Steroidobacteraceae bacterium]